MQGEVKTPEQVLNEFREAGISVGGWARRNGFQRTLVYALLTGRLKGTYGAAHQAAVALGIKQGRIVNEADFKPVLREAA